MKAWKAAAIAAVLVTVTAAGIGVALPPRAQAQEAVVAVTPPEPPYVDVDAVVQGALAWTRGGRLGVTIRDVNDDDVKKGGPGTSRGVVIEQVSSDSAAEKAGFKSGDLVVEFDGERVRSAQQFTRLVQETPAGRSVSAVVVRAGQKTTLTVEPRDSWVGFGGDFGNMLRYEIPSRIVTPRPPTPPRVTVPPTPAPMRELFEFSLRAGTTLGVTVSDMSDQLGEYFGAKDGALVTSVTDNSPAARAGLKAGDVITAINGQEIKVPSDVRRATQRLAAGAEFTIDVLRDKKKLTLKGKTEARQTGRRIVI